MIGTSSRSMFPSLHISASGLCERGSARRPSDLEASFPQPAIRAPQPSTSVSETRPSLTNVSLSAVGGGALQPFHNLPFCGPSLSGPSGALALPSPLLHYPSLYPGQAGDLKHISFTHYQAVNQAAFATEMSKLKSPFINRNYLELAMLVCNTFRGKLFPCPHCRYVTDRRNNLKRHISTMHQACDKVLECCGVHFTTKASLREHIMIFHHNGYSCPYCGRRFCRKALLKRHLSVHSGQKDYTCPHCDYATSHKSNLERHKRIHDRLRIGDDGDKSDEFIDPCSPSYAPDTTGTHCEDKDDDVCEIVDDVSDDDDLDLDDDEDMDACSTMCPPMNIFAKPMDLSDVSKMHPKPEISHAASSSKVTSIADIVNLSMPSKAPDSSQAV
ncbi:zinc finger protein 271-like [Haliotis rufescens]|uniref:zinc finger protein 271-like n=1 Tax=Haliotis rufescens TaxID=6454 RepID=UPI001EAFB6C1|nr:zinc finger protein 271-like [Haliotis rufescens]